MHTLFKENLDELRANNLYRSLKSIDGEQGPEIVFQGKKYLNFSSNNYLGLANHPLLKEAAIEAIQKYGTGSGASRLITGSMSLHDKLEQEIAHFKGTESALVFNSGYHANIGIISSLMREGDTIFSDELNHASIIDGCRLSKANTKIYRHNDLGHLEKMLKSPQVELSMNAPPLKKGDTGGFSNRLIITDTIFSMDGDLCPLPDLMKLAEKYNAWVLVDEAHATGIFGGKGRGLVEESGVLSQHPLLIQMGTLGKALGSFGAYVCGTHELRDYLINKARSLIYTTSLPPGVLAASRAAIKLIQQDTSFKKQVWENTHFFKSELSKIVAQTPFQLADSQSPIVPLIIGDAQHTMHIAEELFNQGIWAHGIRPPTVAAGTSRIRFTLMATHTRKHLEYCLQKIEDCLKKVS